MDTILAHQYSLGSLWNYLSSFAGKPPPKHLPELPLKSQCIHTAKPCNTCIFPTNAYLGAQTVPPSNKICDSSVSVPSVADGGTQTQRELEIIAGGTTGLIKLRAQKTYVEKAPYPDSQDTRQSLRELQREYIAYQRLPQHGRLLRLHPDSTPEKLVLPYLPNGSLHNFLRARPVISPAQRLQFAADAAEGLHVLHCAGIIHGDINSWNFLINDDFRLCIIDFAGAGIDSESGSGFEGVRYCLPRSMDDPSTIQTDLFALGSLLYEIMTGEEPYYKHKDEEVEELFKNGQFPPTEDLLLGWVISGCWQKAYDSADLVHKGISETMSKQLNEEQSM